MAWFRRRDGKSEYGVGQERQRLEPMGSDGCVAIDRSHPAHESLH